LTVLHIFPPPWVSGVFYSCKISDCKVFESFPFLERPLLKALDPVLESLDFSFNRRAASLMLLRRQAASLTLSPIFLSRLTLICLLTPMPSIIDLIRVQHRLSRPPLNTPPPPPPSYVLSLKSIMMTVQMRTSPIHQKTNCIEQLSCFHVVEKALTSRPAVSPTEMLGFSLICSLTLPGFTPQILPQCIQDVLSS